MEKLTTNRRDFLKTMGGLTIAFSLGTTGAIGTDLASEIPLDRPDESRINAWLQVLENGNVRVITGKMELGQGIKTAMRQVAAEELMLPFENTEIQIAETGVTPNEGYTAGSRSIESSAMQIRQAAACAREKLIELAAQKWNVSFEKIDFNGGECIYNGEHLSISDLLGAKQITESITEPREIYGKTKRNIVGKPIGRDDIKKMVRGEMTYVQDLRFDNMVHARVVRPPSYRSRLENVDLQNLKASLTIVRDGSFIGVLAEDEWQAVEGRKEVEKRCIWSADDRLPDQADLKEIILKLPTDSQQDEKQGDPDRSIDGATKQHESTYFKPYIMHASNGPSCAVALFSENQLTVWTHSQGVYPLRESLAAMLDLPTDQIHVVGVQGSGCYGHNGADDVAAEASIFAVNYPGRHVRLQWMRDDEHGWEPFGTAMVMKIKAGLDSAGKIIGWKYDLWSDGHSTRPRGDAGSLLPARYMEDDSQAPSGGFRGGATRNAIPYYTTGAFELNSHIFSGPLRNSALRGLGAYANIFAIECFMDELAENSGINPFQFRVSHLEDSRARDCLNRLEEIISDTSPDEGQGLGIAFSRYKNSASYCAVAALVDAADETNPTVRRMWAVVDSGEVINPDGLKNQIEGGMIQSASWAIKEHVKFDHTHVTSLDWNSYPILRFQEVPMVEVEVIDRPDQPPLGAGEASQGPATAAIVNAYHRATGVRVRDLPLAK